MNGAAAEMTLSAKNGNNVARVVIGSDAKTYTLVLSGTNYNAVCSTCLSMQIKTVDSQGLESQIYTFSAANL